MNVSKCSWNKNWPSTNTHYSEVQRSLQTDSYKKKKKKKRTLANVLEVKTGSSINTYYSEV
jgi:Zn-finger nucleic acid-binding protein